VTHSLARRLGPLATVLILFGLLAAPVVAQEDEGRVTFRVTLEGPVDPTHSFAVQREYSNAINSAQMVCGIPSPSEPQLPLCSATTYEFSVGVPAGETIEYELVRWPTSDLSSDAAERYLRGEWEVQGGRIRTISLGYVYPDENGAGDNTLPDTAMSNE